MGLFPDNFVEMITAKNEEQEQWHETSVTVKSSIRHSHQIKKSEKAHVRKSLDSRNAHPSNISGKICLPCIEITSLYQLYNVQCFCTLQIISLS